MPEKEENSALIFKKANCNYIESQIMRLKSNNYEIKGSDHETNAIFNLF